VLILSDAPLSASIFPLSLHDALPIFTFTLYNPSHVAVYTDVVTVSGNGNYDTTTGTNPGGYLPSDTGTYLWTATYSGDANNSSRSEEHKTELQSLTQIERRIQPVTQA